MKWYIILIILLTIPILGIIYTNLFVYWLLLGIFGSWFVVGTYNRIINWFDDDKDIRLMNRFRKTKTYKGFNIKFKYKK